MSKRYWSSVTAVAIAAALGGIFLARSLNSPNALPLESGTAYPQRAPLGGFSLVDANGAKVTPAELRGHPTLVFFGFTNCPNVCPTTLAQLVGVQQQAKVPGLRIALITVDPERDTPEQIGKYVASFGRDLIGLTGAPPEIVKAKRAFGVASERADQAGGGYTMDHSATVFVLDSEARKVAVFTPPLNPEALTRDLQKLAPTLGTS
jgi:protein SCO1